MKKIVSSILVLFTFSSLVCADVWNDLAQFTASDSLTQALPEEIHKLINQTPVGERGPIEQKLLANLASSTATIESKKFCFLMLQRIGTDASVPVLATYLLNEEFSSHALYVLGSMTDSAAAEQSLLKALEDGPDHLKISFIGSLADRGSMKAVPAMVKLLDSNNVALIQAAMHGLGRIGGPQAAKVLQNAKVIRDSQSSQADVLIAHAKNIVDPGAFFSLDKGGVEPVNQEYVSSEGQPGWKGEYFTNKEFRDEPELTRRDEKILFNWKHGSPDPSIGENDFSVRWTGILTPPTSRAYVFNVDTDDGVKVSIGDTVLFDHLGGGLRDSSSLELEGGKPYSVTFQFIEGGGEAKALFTWDCASKARMVAGREKIVNVPAKARELALLDVVSSQNSDTAYDLFINGQNAGVQMAAFRKLLELNPKLAIQSMSKAPAPIRPAVIRSAMEMENEKVRGFLVKQMAQRPAEEQLAYLGAISDLQLSQFENDVIALLDSTEGELRNVVIYTLGAVGGKASFQPIYQAYQLDASPAATFAITQLPVPSVDEELLKVVGESSDMDARLSAITPLALRNPPGAADLLNRLASPGQDDGLRKASYKALETMGDIESCKMFIQTIVSKDPWARKAQGSLKKLCINTEDKWGIWDQAFRPGLNNAPDDTGREALLAILDGLDHHGALEYLKKQIQDPKNPLRAASIRSLGRWPSFQSGEVWVDIIQQQEATDKELKAAERGLIRVLTREEIKGNLNDKLKLAVRVIEEAPSYEFKQAILNGYKDISGHTRGRMREFWKPLLDDQDVRARVEEMLK